MTYRERREARADRLDEWADKRQSKQHDLNEAARADEAATGIPFGQPILVGHHSERRHRAAIARIDRNMAAAVDNARKAESMSSRAESIRAAADQAIYSDDPDAVERLTGKIERLEAERARIKAYNRTCSKRKALDMNALTEEQMAAWTADILGAHLTKGEVTGLMSSIRHSPFACKGGRFPSYHLTNLGGVISTARKRLAELQNPRPPMDRVITARYGGACEDCGATLERDALIRYTREQGARCYPACEEAAA
jgi:uncharacterized protein DUF3560